MNRYLYYLDENKFGYEDDKEKSEREDVIASGEEFVLTVIAKQVDGVKERVEALQQKYPNAKIEMDLSFERDYIYEESEMKLLEDVDKFCSSKDIKLYISLSNLVGGEYQNILMARNQIEELKQKVNNFTYEENGKQVKLSTYEKFLIVYKFVANRVYNMGDNCMDHKKRNWIGVLTSDQVICSGFASLLKCVCDQVFSADELKCYEQGSDVYNENAEKLGGHANNLIIIKDDKYNLNGLYYADACWDSKDERRDNKTTFNYCLIPIQQIVEHKGCNFAFDTNILVYKNINPYYSQGHERGKGCQLMEDIVKKFGFKSEQELIDIAKAQKQQNEKMALQIKGEIDKEVKNFFNSAGFDDLERFKMADFYPDGIFEKYPEIDNALHFFRNIKYRENLQNEKIIKEAKKYKKVLEDNEKQLNEINSKLIQGAKSVGLAMEEHSIFECVADWIFKEYSGVAKSEYDIISDCKEQYNKQIDECLRVGKDFIYSQPIDDKKFAKGLVAMAKYVGLEENKIKDWVAMEVEKRKEYQTNTFCGKEVVFPQEEKQADENMFDF